MMASLIINLENEIFLLKAIRQAIKDARFTLFPFRQKYGIMVTRITRMAWIARMAKMKEFFLFEVSYSKKCLVFFL